MAIAPLAGWKVESAHPEQVMQGLGAGLIAIAQGISAAYKSKHDEKRENALLNDKYANALKIAQLGATSRSDIANMRTENALTLAGLNNASKQERESLKEEITQHLATVPKEANAPSIQKANAQNSPDGVDPATTAPSEQDKQLDKDVMDGATFDNPALPDTSTDQKFQDVQFKKLNDPSLLPSQGSNDLNSTFDPSQISSLLSGINPNSVTASTQSGPSNAQFANLGLPYDPKAGMQQAQQFGISAIPVQQQARQLLATIPNYQNSQQQSPAQASTITTPSELQQGKVQSIPGFDRIIGVNQMMPQDDAIALRNYAISKGMIPPEIKQSEKNQNNFTVIWPTTQQQLEIKKTAQEEARQKDNDASNKAMRQERLIMGESRAYNLQKPISNFLDRNGPRAQLAPFISAYENAKNFPSASGSSDVTMFDLYGRAMSGGRLTDSQLAFIKSAASLKDKFEALAGHPFTGQLTDQNIRDQMLRELAENVNIGADAANKVVTGVKHRLQNNGIPEKQASVFYYLGGHDPENQFMLVDDAKNAINQSAQQIHNLYNELENAKSSNDVEKEQIIKRQIDGVKHRASVLHKRIVDESDTNSSLLGAKAMRDKNIEEGFGAGDYETTPVYNINN
jgi:hypothetical protein